MKNLKYALLSSVIFLCSNIILAQQKTSICFVNTIKNQNDFVILNMGDDTETTEWDKNYIRVLVNVEAKNISRGTLKYLARTGRYKVLTKQGESFLQLSNPTLSKYIKVGGIDLNEKISYQIFVPRNTNVKQLKPTAFVTTSTIPSNNVSAADTDKQSDTFAKFKMLNPAF